MSTTSWSLMGLIGRRMVHCPTVVEPTRGRQFGGTVIESTAHEEEEQLNLPPLKRRAVWACRNLRTLHISILKQDDKDCARHESSLVTFEYMSLACPRLEELSIRSEWMALDDESRLCLLGWLKYLERLQLHSLPTLMYPDVFWMRRKKFKSGFLHPVNGRQHAFLTEQTLLGRIIAKSRNPWSGRVHVTDPTMYLKNLPPLPDFQESKPFLTEDGTEFSSVGRPDALVAYVMDTNKDLMADSDTSIGAWNRDAVCLPRLDLLHFRQSGDFRQETADAEQFLRTLRPEIDLRIEIAKYYI
ncbi:hypothetical protein F5H01DRAFT_372468 [Linnemannia elongata]|nr:hypothetical protein F5H01DRAFT_372468 [Linnemannia elongata]